MQSLRLIGDGRLRISPFAMAEPVSIDICDAIATLTLDDGKANALALGMSQGIGAALTDAALLCRLYAPSEAVNVGYLDQAVAPEAFDRTVAESARELAKLDPSALAETKGRLRQATADRMLQCPGACGPTPVA